MIVWIVLAGLGLLTTVFLVMPPLPPTPPELINLMNSFNDILLFVIQIIRYFLSPELTLVMFLVVLAVFVTEPAYHGIMWILKKIPVVNIK